MDYDVANAYAPIKYETDTVAWMERCHFGITSAARFKGFVNNWTTFNQIAVGSLTEGDYYIIIKNFYDDVTFQSYNTGDIYYKKSGDNVSLQRAKVAKITDASVASNLITKYSQGDVFSFEGVEKMFDFTNDAVGQHHLTTIVEKDGSLDTSQILPVPVVNGTVKRILITDENFITSSTVVKYADNTPKFDNVYAKDDLTSEDWLAIGNSVYDGDVLIYNETYSRWHLVANVVPTNTEANLITRLKVFPSTISNLNSLFTGLFFGRIHKIDVSSVDISANVDMFVNPPEDLRIYLGDLLICDGTKWIIFNDDYYEFQHDITVNGSSFPEPIVFGTVFPVTVPVGSTVTNFKGGTQTVTYTTGDKILYYGKDTVNDLHLWKKYDIATLPVFDPDAVEATTGDLIVLDSVGGTFGSEVANIKVPSQTLDHTGRLFDYNDILYYTGTELYCILLTIDLDSVIN